MQPSAYRKQQHPRALTILFIMMALSGCAAPAVDPGPHPAWPAPPASPRIIHRQNLRSADDLRRPGFLRNLDRLITGGQIQALLRPHGAAVDQQLRLYVTDQELQGLHIFDLTSGKSRFINRMGKTFLVSPVGVVVCGRHVAISDSALRAVFLLTPEGQLVRRIGLPDAAPPTRTTANEAPAAPPPVQAGAGLQRPTGLGYHEARGELFVVDTLAREILVFNLEGRLLRRFGSAGTDVGQFNFPTHVFVSADDLVYVTDSLNFRVQAFDLEGNYRFDVGKHGDASGHLGVPKGVAVDRFGHIYVVDSYFGTVQIFDAQGRFLLNFGQPGREPGHFEIPTGLTIDHQNRIYVCDSYNGRVQVFEYLGGANDEP